MFYVITSQLLKYNLLIKKNEAMSEAMWIAGFENPKYYYIMRVPNALCDHEVIHSITSMMSLFVTNNRYDVVSVILDSIFFLVW